jgi:hypothetical protein
MTNRPTKKILIHAPLAVLVLALAFAMIACGGGQTVEGACSDVCNKLADCLGQTDPAQIAQCEADCTADGNAAPACENAIYDAVDCIEVSECAAILDGSACATEGAALEAACPGA